MLLDLVYFSDGVVGVEVERLIVFGVFVDYSLSEYFGNVFAFEERRGFVRLYPGELSWGVLSAMDWVDGVLVGLIGFGEDFLFEVFFKITFHESEL